MTPPRGTKARECVLGVAAVRVVVAVPGVLCSQSERRAQASAALLADEGRASGGANGVSTAERANGEGRPVSEQRERGLRRCCAGGSRRVQAVLPRANEVSERAKDRPQGGTQAFDRHFASEEASSASDRA